MTNNRNRIDKAIEATEYDIEIIYDINEGRDFVEIVGDIGGDAVTRRVYFDENDEIVRISAK